MSARTAGARIAVAAAGRRLGRAGGKLLEDPGGKSREAELLVIDLQIALPSLVETAVVALGVARTSRGALGERRTRIALQGSPLDSDAALQGVYLAAAGVLSSFEC